MRRFSAALLLPAAIVLAAGLLVAAAGMRAPSALPEAEAVPTASPSPSATVGVPEPAVLAFESDAGQVRSPGGHPRPALGMSPTGPEAAQEKASQNAPAAQASPVAKPLPMLSSLVPILMYHNVRPIDFATTNAFVSSLTLPPTQFENQLRYLKERGFASVSLRDVADHLAGRRQLPPRPVVLTFDDGFENNHRYAAPLLKTYGFTGTFFVITSLVGGAERMTWKQVSDLAAGGNEIGSHTMTHPDLSASSAASRVKELVGSKEALERALGGNVVALSYPSGAYNADTIDAATRAGYVVAVTTRYGAVLQGGKPMELPRIRVQGTDELPTFRWRIEQYFPTGDPVKQ